MKKSIVPTLKSIVLKVEVESSILTILQCVCMKRFVWFFWCCNQGTASPHKDSKKQREAEDPRLTTNIHSSRMAPKTGFFFKLFFLYRYKILLIMLSLKQIVHMCVAQRPNKASFHSWVWRSCCSWFWWLRWHHCVSIASYEKEGSLNLIDILIWVCFAQLHVPYHRLWFRFFSDS